ncbi:hypothetical protein HII31_06911 [Pseudocercospora fuligena]|uniref:Glycosyltransferase family 25 protein n=1 Tax=Pseudocercospora fuligena TaxID=685502 RepID=A0A8H6RG51_9PEZI|nr:hypothetical protein HII31_06911 [Pseudocercospora fuligena]
MYQRLYSVWDSESELKTKNSPNRLCTHRNVIVGGVGFIVILLLGAFAFSGSVPESIEWHKDDLLDDVNNSTLGFQKILVVNLPSRTDKRDAMSLAAAFSGLEVEYVAGVTDVDPKTLPPGGAQAGRTPAEMGNWRAHMNAVQRVVELNLSSALIMEDDADWDVRIKDQMRDFAKASRVLLQPIRGSPNKFLDPTVPEPKEGQKAEEFSIDDEDRVSSPKSSRYGDLDRRDLLWPGHCGSGWPPEDLHQPLGRVLIKDDPTVPETQHIDQQMGSAEFMEIYPNHTRVISHAHNNLCMLAYAISQKGAQRILFELGINSMSGPTDVGFRQMCHGQGVSQGGHLTCLTLQPQLFGQHRPAGAQAAFSDISGAWTGNNKQAYTRNIRQSVRLNFEKLAAGVKTGFTDLLKDGEEGYKYGWLSGDA